MAVRLFKTRHHIEFYQKYRFPPSENLQSVIFSYLEEKKVNPIRLAVDVGCGLGQSTRVLAAHFEKVVGIDISEAQTEAAKQAASFPNVSYLVCPAEELPFEDGSVDLITAFAAAHWFDLPRFMKEVDRVLKPHGCMALSTYTTAFSMHYKDCSDRLTEIFTEVTVVLGTSPPSRGAVFSGTRLMPRQQEQEATWLNSERTFLETMGVCSNETQVEIRIRSISVLGCKGK